MKFLVDRMLGKLAKQLRMLGYDTVYHQGGDFSELIQVARQQGRTILTRKSDVHPGRPEDTILTISEDNPNLQMKALVRQGGISLDETRPFSRCLLCNDLLMNISRTEAEGKVPEYVLSHQKQFVQCPKCRRIYWKGSHQEKMEKWMEELFQSS